MDLNTVYCDDTIIKIKDIDDNSVHLILSDIPYGISFDSWDVLHTNNNSALLGSSPAQKKAGDIFKKRGKPLNGWSKEDKLIAKQYYDWVTSWVYDWYRVLKPGASAFVFAGRRLAPRCVCAFEDAGFTIKSARKMPPFRVAVVHIISLYYIPDEKLKEFAHLTGLQIKTLAIA